MSAASSIGTDPNALFTQGTQAGRAGRHKHPGFGGDQFKADFAKAAQAAGVDASKVDDLQKQIDAAVQDAVKNGGNGDKRAAIQSAVDGVLKENGVDVQKFQDALKAQHANKARGPHGHRAHKPDGDGDDALQPPATKPTGSATDASQGLDTTA